MDAGEPLATFLTDSVSPANAVPDAPVESWILERTTSNVSPISPMNLTASTALSASMANPAPATAPRENARTRPAVASDASPTWVIPLAAFLLAVAVPLRVSACRF